MGIQQIPLASSGLSASDLIGADKYTLLAEFKSGANTTQITFSNIPQTYSKLVLNVHGLRDASNAGFTPFIRLNNDSTSGVYGRVGRQLTNGSSNDEAYTEPSSSIYRWCNSTYGAQQRISGYLEILNYATTDAKVMKSAFYGNSTGGANMQSVQEGFYRTGSTTNAITSLYIAGNSGNLMYVDDAVNHAVSLYGVK